MRGAWLKSCLVIALSLVSLAPRGYAQVSDWPNRPLRFVVPLPPGGGSDIVARIVAKKLGEELGQPIFVTNTSGAAGIVGTQEVIRSAPDGYTFLVITTLQITAQLSAKTPAYDLDRDLANVGLLVEYPYVLIANKDSRFDSLPALIEAAKKKPGEIAFGSSGVGSGNHVLVEDLASRASIDLNHIPYHGNAQALNDLYSGQIALLADGVPATLGIIRNGAVRALAVTSLQRWSDLQDVPTVADTLPGFSYAFFVGLSAPKGTPPKIIEKLSQALHQALADPEVQKRFSDVGVKASPATSSELGNYIRASLDTMRPVVTKLNIGADGN